MKEFCQENYVADFRVEQLIELARQFSAFQETIRITMQVDIGGLGLIDPQSGEAILSGPAGRNTDNLLGLKIPAGKGLAGVVWQKQEPFTLKDYIKDEAINHDVEVDRAVAGEGIISSAGAPLYAGSNIAGIVYAWHRNRKNFGKSDLQLLSQVGNRFSRYIENNYNVIIHGLEKADFINCIDGFTGVNHDLLNSYEKFLATLQCGEGQLEGIIDLLASLLKHPVALFDERKEIRASSYKITAEERDYLTEYVVSKIDELFKVDFIMIDFPDQLNKGILTPVRAGNHISGYLYIQGLDLQMKFREKKLIQGARMALAMYELKERAALEVEQKLQGSIINGLINGNLENREALWRQFSRWGIDLKKPNRLIIVDVNNERNELEPWLLKRLEYQIGGLYSIINKYLVALIPHEDHHQALQTAGEIIKNVGLRVRDGKFLALVTEKCVTLEDYPLGFKEASYFLQSVSRGAFDGQIISLEQIGPQRLFVHPANQEYLKSYIKKLFGSLLQYDQKKKTNLIDTLIEYFATGCCRQETAARMHVHLHTLDYRLRRIQEIARINLSDPQERFNIQMAVEAYKILRLTDNP